MGMSEIRFHELAKKFRGIIWRQKQPETNTGAASSVCARRATAKLAGRCYAIVPAPPLAPFMQLSGVPVRHAIHAIFRRFTVSGERKDTPTQ